MSPLTTVELHSVGIFERLFVGGVSVGVLDAGSLTSLGDEGRLVETEESSRDGTR